MMLLFIKWGKNLVESHDFFVYKALISYDLGRAQFIWNSPLSLLCSGFLKFVLCNASFYATRFFEALKKHATVGTYQYNVHIVAIDSTQYH